MHINKRILVLEPFYGGSHRAFLQQWAANCALDFTTFGLPDKFWRWRTRHAAVYFADKLSSLPEKELQFDLIFCSSMLNLPEFRGLAPEVLRNLPAVVYFHENQLVYPVHNAARRDQNAILVNFKSALAAEQVWFNSAYNRDTFLDKLPEFFARMPDHQPLAAIETIRRKSKIFPPGIEAPRRQNTKSNFPKHILWAARWEADKNPSDFFKALRLLRKHKIDFRLSVIGENASRTPDVFTGAGEEFAAQTVNWGYVDSREKYLEILADADIIVSTAVHEFFGISVVEAIATGAYPLLPRRLAYPEVLALHEHPGRECFFYGESADELGEKLLECCSTENDLWAKAPALPDDLAGRYYWPGPAALMTEQLRDII